MSVPLRLPAEIRPRLPGSPRRDNGKPRRGSQVSPPPPLRGVCVRVRVRMCACVCDVCLAAQTHLSLCAEVF